MNDVLEGIRGFNPDTTFDDEGDAQDESKGFDNLDSDPESETDESTVEPSAPELVSGDEKQVDATIIDGYSQDDELERGNEPIMDQGMGAEDLSELPWWKRLFAPISELEEEITPAAPAITIDEVRSVVQEEISRTEADLSRLVLLELAREQENRQRAKTAAVHDLTEIFYESKVENLRLEFEALQEEEQILLQDREQPLRERMENVDFIRKRMDKLELKQEIAEHEAEISQRAADTEQTLAEPEGRSVMADFHSELVRQKAIVDNIPKMVNVEVDHSIASSRSKNYFGMGLWTILLGLLLISVVGVAGILLPRQTGPSPSFLVDMASMYKTGGETEEAIRVLDKAVEAGIDDVETLGHVGEMYHILQQYGKAVEVLERAVERAPENETYRLSLAKSYTDAGKYQDAIVQYQELIQIAPTNAAMYYTKIGTQYRILNNEKQAMAQYQEALKVDPVYWLSIFYQAEVYRAQQRYDDAIAQYQKTLEINPYHYWSYLYMGVSYVGKNDLTRAIDQYLTAISIDSGTAEAYYYLGEAYLSQGNFNQALEAYQQAIERNNSHTNAYVGLGKAYAVLGDCAKAINQFTRALVLDPNNTEAKEGLATCEGSS